jgi:hypothetical protein
MEGWTDSYRVALACTVAGALAAFFEWKSVKDDEVKKLRGTWFSHATNNCALSSRSGRIWYRLVVVQSSVLCKLE